jgi:tetratricopeptide (TPR) repeat protein
MRSRKHVIVVSGLGLLLATATAAPAMAQPASSAQPYPAACSSVPPTESDRAHTLYQAGKAYYDDANYDAAITQFREAYKKDCTKHDLLIIISRAYELKSDRVAAINALEEYLQRVPSSPDAQQHKTRIENLRKQAAAQPAPAPAPAPPPAAAPPSAPPQETREHTTLPWVVVAVGGAAMVAGIVVLATSPSLPEGCFASTKTCTRGTNEPLADFDDRQAVAGRSQIQPTVGAVILGGGGALVVGGLLWHFLEPTGPVEKTGNAKPRVAPQVAPGFAGLSLGGSF